MNRAENWTILKVCCTATDFCRIRTIQLLSCFQENSANRYSILTLERPRGGEGLNGPLIGY